MADDWQRHHSVQNVCGECSRIVSPDDDIADYYEKHPTKYRDRKIDQIGAVKDGEELKARIREAIGLGEDEDDENAGEGFNPNPGTSYGT